MVFKVANSNLLWAISHADWKKESKDQLAKSILGEAFSNWIETQFKNWKDTYIKNSNYD